MTATPFAAPPSPPPPPMDWPNIPIDPVPLVLSPPDWLILTVPPETAVPPAPPNAMMPLLTPAVPPPPPMACAEIPCEDWPVVEIDDWLLIVTVPLAPPIPASAPALPNSSKLPVVTPPTPPMDWPRMPMESSFLVWMEPPVVVTVTASPAPPLPAFSGVKSMRPLLVSTPPPAPPWLIAEMPCDCTPLVWMLALPFMAMLTVPPLPPTAPLLSSRPAPPLPPSVITLTPGR
ncbi:hypothetical protein D3C85_744640 [compost metagenome]